MKQFIQDLEIKIRSAYENGVSLVEAERLAGEFLAAQLQVSSLLTSASLDAKMKKSGVKSIRAAVYLGEIQEASKKPSDVLLEAIVNSHPDVKKEQDALDQAEVELNELERVYNVFQNAHIFYRGVAKQGSF